jgi:acetylornithine deacetylase/succinyl-diaminopimelate desuccinylase-like protein
MILPRRAIVFAAILLLSISVHCRRASGGDVDPLDAEAETAFLQYLRIDTSNPPGHETAGARFLQQLFAKEGIETRLLGSDPERQSLYARLPCSASSKPKEKALLLLHHIDVVPAPRSEWTKPAFAGLKADGYLWGRGALDIKSLGIAEAMALIELKRRAVALRRDVVYLAVADEEMGGLRGCKEILDAQPELFADVGYVINEGGYNETIVDKVAFWGIEVSQKVPLWLRITTRGAAGHSAAPPDNGGSVAQLIHALDAVENIATPYRLESSVGRYFKALGRTKHDYRGEIMLAMKEPLDLERVKALSPGYRALLRDTIAFTHISGGASMNSIPAQASCDVDIRLLPDESPEAMLARVRDAVGKHADVAVILEGRSVKETATDTDLYRTLAATMQASEPGSVAAPTVGAGTSDSRFFRERGMVAYGIAPFKVNYYDADTVHGSDERIRERFFMEGTRLMRRIVASFCARGE